jgi:2-phospho-L-lactate transferase/gluconeogenesis factor (CofD/UPF0052 family)
MNLQRPGRTAITMFSGGRGTASIARQLLRTSRIQLSLIINGYDNGQSTGALRHYLPGMLGPSDFRKNLLLHLNGDSPQQAALIAVLEHRLPPSATRTDLDKIIEAFAGPGSRDVSPPFALLPQTVRAAITRELSVFRNQVESRPTALSLADCALGNLIFAGAYLRMDRDFNSAIRSCAQTFGSPVDLVNVTNGENAFLVALSQGGGLLADEAEIVAPPDAATITDLFLLREPPTPGRRAELATLPIEDLRQALTRESAEISLSSRARDAIKHADLIVYGPGTPHSSLLPSYLTPGIAEAITASRASAKVFVVNIRDDLDVQGLNATDLVDRTLSYLGDPFNERRTITHILCHRAAAPSTPSVPEGAADRGFWAGARWVAVDLENPSCPGTHSGLRTVSALTRITDEARLVRTG